MKQWAFPLKVFVSGNLILLIAFLFMGALDTSVATLESDTAEIASTFWGWEWLMTVGVVRFILVILLEGFILWATGKAFLHQRKVGRW